MTKSPDDYIAIGKVGAPYGVKGWVKIHSFTDWVANIFSYTPWYLEDEHGWKAIRFADGREHGKGLIAKFDGYDTPETVRVLTGKQIAIKRSQLAALDKNEYYWSDLEGLTVINQDGKVLGKIVYLIETGANDVIVVKNEKEHAIPYLPGTVVLLVDLVNRVMHVNWELI